MHDDRMPLVPRLSLVNWISSFPSMLTQRDVGGTRLWKVHVVRQRRLSLLGCFFQFWAEVGWVCRSSFLFEMGAVVLNMISVVPIE